MKISESIDLIWQLAAREAIAAEFKEIEPEHFFLAILKFSEIPLKELEKSVSMKDTGIELSTAVKWVGQALKKRGIESTPVRRRLRGKLGKGDCPYDGRKMHRSNASRRLFGAAASLAEQADSENFKAEHLLEAILRSPTPAIAQALGNDISPKAARPVRTTPSEIYGLDLTQMVANGELADVASRKVESKALMRSLTQTERPHVFLVHESESVTRSVMEATAAAIAFKHCSKALDGKRILDVSSMVPKDAISEITEFMSNVKKVISEAAASKDVILYGLPLTLHPEENEPDAVSELLKESLQRETVTCVFQVPPFVYKAWLEKDPTWKKLAEVIWIHDEKWGEIPTEL
jgi:ATP-dependent Clp protease ATP-binding subunit ClpA